MPGSENSTVVDNFVWEFNVYIKINDICFSKFN